MRSMTSKVIGSKIFTYESLSGWWADAGPKTSATVCASVSRCCCCCWGIWSLFPDSSFVFCLCQTDCFCCWSSRADFAAPFSTICSWSFPAFCVDFELLYRDAFRLSLCLFFLPRVIAAGWKWSPREDTIKAVVFVPLDFLLKLTVEPPASNHPKSQDWSLTRVEPERVSSRNLSDTSPYSKRIYCIYFPSYNTSSAWLSLKVSCKLSE